jgi:hypothetical protein
MTINCIILNDQYLTVSKPFLLLIMRPEEQAQIYNYCPGPLYDFGLF